ncbi:Coiled-coil domain-containing protein 147 [Symbiodinium microadriaticum]|uniref:Coiled-coil domain-containing protein 147 n=1 Tax=Symbiodinium microadriaticum TaxID=2951 RepID=A0A1Q9EGY1_SYMMI|nr:Coiled-coil domain-containing protein 147 [Symbiodinium microadriaticum]
MEKDKELLKQNTEMLQRITQGRLDEVQHLEKGLGEAEAQILVMKEKIGEKRGEVEVAKRSKDELEQTMKDLREENDQKQEELAAARRNIATEQTELRKIQQAVADTEKEEERLERRVHQRMDEKRKLEEKLEQEQHKNQKFAQESEEKERLLKSRRDELQRTKKEKEKVIKAYEVLKKKDKATEEERQTNESKRNELKSDVKNHQEKSEVLKRDADVDRKKIEDLLRERDILNKNVVKADERTKKQIDLVKRQSDLDLLRAELLELRSEVFRLRARVAVLEGDRFELVDSPLPSTALRPQPSGLEQPPSGADPTREEVCESVGLFLKRCLNGEHRGASGRDRLPLASRLWIVVRGFDGTVYNPPRIFSRFSSCKPIVKRGSDTGDSIFVDLPAHKDVVLCLRAAPDEAVEDLDGHTFYVYDGEAADEEYLVGALAVPAEEGEAAEVFEVLHPECDPVNLDAWSAAAAFCHYPLTRVVGHVITCLRPSCGRATAAVLLRHDLAFPADHFPGDSELCAFDHVLVSGWQQQLQQLDIVLRRMLQSIAGG